MKLNGRALVYAVLLLILLIILVVLGLRARPIDLGGYDRIVSAQRDLQQFNTDWDLDTLRTRTGQAAADAQVAIPLPVLSQLQNRLAQASQAHWRALGEAGAEQRLKPLQDRLAQVFQNKVDAVEQYKSHNATLGQDVRALRTQAVQLSRTAAIAGQSTDNQSPLGQAINNLQTLAAGYVQAPTSDLHGQLAQASDTISQLTQSSPASVAQAGANMAERAKAVLAQQDVVNQSLARIDALPLAKSLDDLASAQASENQRALAGLEHRQTWLLVYAVVLLALLAWLAVRLLAGQSALSRSRAELERAHSQISAAQVHLIQAEKMSFLGQMMTGIAHEINMPLTDIKNAFAGLKDQLGVLRQLTDAGRGFARQMRAPQRDQKQLNTQFHALETSAQKLGESNVLSDVDQLLARNVQSLEQVARSVANLRSFSQPGGDSATHFSVEQSLDNTLLLAHNLLKNKAEVRKEYGHVPRIPGASSKIGLVFLNLITNAVQAMPMPGQRPPQANLITLRTSLSEDKKTVRVDIQDNGGGIHADLLPKIFDPFFTTKPIGQGTGLGLPLSQKIVQDHGGSIQVESDLGKGATFSILLPVEAQPANPEADDRWATTAAIETEAFRKTALFSDY